MKIKSMRTIQLEYLAIVYQMCEYNKREASKGIGISTRYFSNMVTEAIREKTLGHEIFEVKRIGRSSPVTEMIKLGDRYYSKIFPTNEYRLRYRDNY